MTVQFIHLNLHTEYSIKDSIVRIKPLVKAVAEREMPAVAMTDLCNLFGMVKFYRAAQAAGIKPIIGAHLMIHNEQGSDHFPIILLCQNNLGYKNLTRLISKAYQQGQQSGSPLIQKDWLTTQTTAGLIALSGGLDGDIGHALLGGHDQTAREYLQFWLQLFPQRYYIEIQRINRLQEDVYNQAVLKLAQQFTVPVVATNAVRFIDEEDFEAHEARVCIHQGEILTDAARPRRYTNYQYLRSSQEMIELFSDLPSALQNTVEIAKRCNLELSFDQAFLPKFPVPEDSTVADYLQEVAKQGLAKRWATLSRNETIKNKHDEYQQRLTIEISVINNMGFAGYFLIVADFIRWAKQNNIPVGPGRGSGAGSLVAYALEITDLDPIEHELLFERFLNPERVSMPDFDIDFCMDGRDRVIEYVTEKYGRQSVSQIITFGTMAAKAVVRDVGRVLGFPYGFVDKIAKLIPFELGITLAKALAQEENLRKRYEEEDDVNTLLNLAMKLEGITRNAGKHAGGVVIAPTCLTDFTPLYCEPDDQHLVTQFDKDDVEAVGLVKFDFLGLRTLTIINWAIQTINDKRRLEHLDPINIVDIPTDDTPSYDLLKRCATTAVFQLESRGMKDLIKRLQPDCFDEIVALVALFRPGPLQSGMVDDFIDRKHGRSKIEFFHPALTNILKPTYGVILYQEQVMQISQVLAGYNLGEADLLRRAMGKKKPEEMAKHRNRFIEGAKQKDVDEQTAAFIFDLMEKFSGYGFNKSHSAAYALISYQTAWLKAHYPAAFMAAVLSSDMDNTDKMVGFISECRHMQLTIIYPHMNHSHYKFTVNSDNAIVYGLGAIKGIGQAAAEALIAEREQHGPYENIFDFCCRVDLQKINRRTIEALISAGAMDNLGAHRASLMATIDVALKTAEQFARDKNSGQNDLFATQVAIDVDKYEHVNIKPWLQAQQLTAEKESLGFYLSGHPIDRYRQEIDSVTKTTIAKLRPDNTKTVNIMAYVTSVRLLLTKKGSRMAVITLDDCTGQLDAILFSEAYELYQELLQKDQLLLLQGVVSVDDFSGGLRLTCERVFSLDRIRELYARELLIPFNDSTLNDENIIKLQSVLQLFERGNCPVTIVYQQQHANVQLQLGQNWCVKLTDQLLLELQNQFGENQLQIRYEAAI